MSFRISRGFFSLFLILASALSNRSFFSQEKKPAEFLQLKSLAGRRGGNVSLAISSDPSSFNRMMASGLAATTVTDRLSADLVHINRSTLQLEPALARDWQADKTGQSYLVHLRRGVLFSDGTPFTADDVIFSFTVITDPRVACPVAGQLEVDGTFPSISKIDEFTVRINFPRPIGMGLRMLDSVPILPKNRLWKAYSEGKFSEAWGPAANPQEIVGLGPFRLKEYQRGIKVVLERNPNYWKRDRNGTPLPYLDTLTFLIIPDFTSEALRFQQGELDLINSPSLSPESYATLRRAQQGYSVRDLGPGLTMDYLWFNLNRGTKSSGQPYVDPEKLAIFEKPQFRLAVSCAVDREGIVRSVLLGLGTPQYGPVSSGNAQWYNASIPRVNGGPGRARELLRQIGLRDTNGDGVLEYGTGRRPLELSLITSRGNNLREKSAQVIQSNLSNIGIRVGIQHLLPNEIAARFLNTFEYESILFGFTPTDVTPDLQTNLWYSSGNIHFWQPNQTKPQRPWEAEIDGLISKLIRSTDAADRKASFEQAQAIWAREMPAIPTVAPDILAGWNRKLDNIHPSILAPHLVWNAEEISRQGP